MSEDWMNELRNRIIVVYSPGTGTGKSEIAANLAFYLSFLGKKIWIIDSNTFAPAQDIIFGFYEGERTFSNYLTEINSIEIPSYQILKPNKDTNSAPVYLTPAGRDDKKIRFLVKQQLNEGPQILSKIPLSIYSQMKKDKIDLVIIDTHPSFEEINDVWLAITDFLLIITRINDLELQNLICIVNDANIIDIPKKLVVLTNVKLRDREVSKDMEDNLLTDKLLSLLQNPRLDHLVANCATYPVSKDTTLEFYREAFLYSQKLAYYQQMSHRDALFIEKEPLDNFSKGIEGLARYLLRTRFNK